MYMVIASPFSVARNPGNQNVSSTFIIADDRWGNGAVSGVYDNL